MNLNQVTVPSTQIEKSIQFYQKLGLTLIVHSNAHYARFECPDGSSTFSIHNVEKVANGDGIVVYFEVEDVEKTVTDLREKGIDFETAAETQPWLWTEARLKDPDNNQIIIYHAGGHRKNPPWRIQA